MFLTSVLGVAVLHATRHESHTIIKECNIIVHSDYILNKYSPLYELRLSSDDWLLCSPVDKVTHTKSGFILILPRRGYKNKSGQLHGRQYILYFLLHSCKMLAHFFHNYILPTSTRHCHQHGVTFTRSCIDTICFS